MLQEPILLTYRRPSNSIFLRNKKYFAYFTNEINGKLMVYTSTEKKTIDGPFFLEDFYYPEDDSNSDILIPSDLTIENFQQFVAFYDQYWLEQLEEQAYYCHLARETVLNGNLKTVINIFSEKLDVYREYYYDPQVRPLSILGYFIDYFFNNDMEPQKVLASTIILLRGLEIDPNETFLEPDTKILESICRLYLSGLWAQDDGMVAFMLGALISEGADYQVYYDGKHFVQWVYDSLNQEALKIIDDLTPEFKLSYAEFDLEFTKIKFIISNPYLEDDYYYSSEKAKDFLEAFKTALPGSFEQVFTRDFGMGNVTFYADKEYEEWIEVIKEFGRCNLLSGDKECEELVFAIQNGYHNKIRNLLTKNRDLLFRKHKDENAIVYALSTMRTQDKRIPKVLNILKEHGFDFDQKDCFNQPIAISAALDGKYSLVGHLLDLGIDYQASSDSWTLLEALGIKEKFDLFLRVYRLINPDLNQPFHSGRTILHSICIGNNFQAIQFLLDEGYDPNIVDEAGATPLMVSLMTERTNYQAIETLLKSGKVDLDYPHFESRENYLHLAVRTGKPYRVQLVLNYFQDVNAKNASGDQPLDLLANLVENLEHKEEELRNEIHNNIYEIYWMLKERGATFAFQTKQKKVKKALNDFEFSRPKAKERIFSIVEVLMDGMEKPVKFEVEEGMELNIGDWVRVPFFNNGERNGIVITEVRSLTRADLNMRLNRLKKVIAKLDDFTPKQGG